MGKLLVVGLWPIAAVTTLVITILLFPIFPSQRGVVKAAKIESDQLRATYNLFTPLTTDNTIGENVTVNDARVEIVRQFLARYDSPLEAHAQLLVDTADRYHLDFRLLPAVAMQESTLCQKIPAKSYNCWGYGIYGDNVIRYDSYEEAIEAVAMGISKDYVHDGLTTPEMIMGRYTPSSNGSWAAAVRLFMEEME